MVSRQNQSADVFKALADPTRRAILSLLRQGRQPVGFIAQEFPVSRPAISKHLRLLRDANLVVESREGRNNYYGLNAGPLKEVDDWLSYYRHMWQNKLHKLKKFIETRN